MRYLLPHPFSRKGKIVFDMSHKLVSIYIIVHYNNVNVPLSLLFCHIFIVSSLKNNVSLNPKGYCLWVGYVGHVNVNVILISMV